jgi:hypothetical protein
MLGVALSATSSYEHDVPAGATHVECGGLPPLFVGETCLAYSSVRPPGKVHTNNTLATVSPRANVIRDDGIP